MPSFVLFLPTPRVLTSSRRWGKGHDADQGCGLLRVVHNTTMDSFCNLASDAKKSTLYKRQGVPRTRGLTSNFPVTENMRARPNGVHTAGTGACQSPRRSFTPSPSPALPSPSPSTLSSGAQDALSLPDSALTQEQEHSEEGDTGVEVGEVVLPEV